MALPPAYSKRFLNAGFSGGGAVDATVPDGKVWVIRDISGFYQSDHVWGVSLDVYAAAVIIYGLRMSPYTSGPFHWIGRQVLYAGESIDVNFVDAGPGGLYIAISGYELVAA